MNDLHPDKIIIILVAQHNTDISDPFGNTFALLQKKVMMNTTHTRQFRKKTLVLFQTRSTEIIPQRSHLESLLRRTAPYFPTLYKKTPRTNKMAFTKAFYEQAFERNLKAQTSSEQTATSVAPQMQMTRTQRATAQFTAYSKKEVVSTRVVFEKIQM